MQVRTKFVFPVSCIYSQPPVRKVHLHQIECRCIHQLHYMCSLSHLSRIASGYRLLMLLLHLCTHAGSRSAACILCRPLSNCRRVGNKQRELSKLNVGRLSAPPAPLQRWIDCNGWACKVHLERLLTSMLMIHLVIREAK